MYYSGYIQTHCQKNKKIKWADQILPEVYGTTLGHLMCLLQKTFKLFGLKHFGFHMMNIIPETRRCTEIDIYVCITTSMRVYQLSNKQQM